MTHVRIAILAAVLFGCTDKAATINTLEKAGFTDVSPGGWKWAACGSGDSYITTFTVTNPKGERVSGVVCCGILKSCTVRF